MPGAVGLLLTACSSPRLPAPPAPSPPPPLVESAAADWAYGARLLVLDDVSSAHEFLERAAEGGTISSAGDRAQLYRDLAEVRLTVGDPAGAAAAVHVSADALDRAPLNARFTPAERRLGHRLLEALLAAADGDVAGLTAACSTDEAPPASDACYLLGWTYEQQGQVDPARRAYQVYLERAPAWSFLRRAPAMRQHALSVLAGGSL